MPTKNPRLQVPFSQETYDTIAELAQVRGESKASIVREIIELMAPTLQRTTQALKKIEAQERFLKAQKAGTESGFRARAGSILEDAEKELAPFLQAMENMFSEFEKIPTQPPHSNTGVTPPSSNPPQPVDQAEKPCKISHLTKKRHRG